jgi:hypothetical protein
MIALALVIGIDDLGSRERRLAIEGLGAAQAFLHALSASHVEGFALAASLASELARLHVDLARAGRAPGSIPRALEHAREVLLAAHSPGPESGEAVAALLEAELLKARTLSKEIQP